MTEGDLSYEEITGVLEFQLSVGSRELCTIDAKDVMLSVHRYLGNERNLKTVEALLAEALLNSKVPLRRAILLHTLIDCSSQLKCDTLAGSPALVHADMPASTMRTATARLVAVRIGATAFNQTDESSEPTNLLVSAMRKAGFVGQHTVVRACPFPIRQAELLEQFSRRPMMLLHTLKRAISSKPPVGADGIWSLWHPANVGDHDRCSDRLYPMVVIDDAPADNRGSSASFSGQMAVWLQAVRPFCDLSEGFDEDAVRLVSLPAPLNALLFARRNLL